MLMFSSYATFTLSDSVDTSVDAFEMVQRTHFNFDTSVDVDADVWCE